MTLLPGFYRIISFEAIADDVYVATIRLHADHAIFSGHFPGNPVAPGVCMMHILKELVEKAEQKKLCLVCASTVKFTALINPNENPILQFTFEILHEKEQIKVKNTTSFGDTVALKLTNIYRSSFL